MMDSTKMDAFFKKMLERTKLGTLSWSRGTPRDIQSNLSDEEYSFFCSYKDGAVAIVRDVDGDVACWVKPDSDLGWALLSGENDEEFNSPTLLRLYNYIYEKFPSIDSFIDSVIEGD